MSIITIIVTHNPDLHRFKLVLASVAEQVNCVVIVDNGSDSKDFIKDLCINN